MNRSDMQITANCTGCIHAEDILIFNGITLVIDPEYKYCRTLNKYSEVLEKTGKIPSLYVAQKNVHCQVKELIQ